MRVAYAWTGEVLVLASTPSFDPGAFAAGLTPAAWQKLVVDPENPLNNKPVGGVYAPGSTFKPLVAMAALEAGAITPDTEFFCPGTFSLGNAMWHCWKKGGHGSISLRRAIRESCDVFFYHCADLLGIDKIAQMANHFGLGVNLNIDIPGEKTGLIPTRAWKMATTGIPWQRGETVSCGIGQSFVSVTPLQLATYVARLATSRAVMPRLVRKHGVMKADSLAATGPDPDFEALGIQAAHLNAVLDGMVAVVNEQHGTAYNARIKDPVMMMGGKTGTAQVHRYSEAERAHGHLTGASVPWKDRDHALFIGFAPVSAPRYVCAVVVEHGGASGGEGGAVAAPIASEVLLAAQRRDPARRVPDQPFSAPTTLAEG
jgi:penicillin-binding protein 2